MLYHIAGKRLAAGRITVIDATNTQRDARAQVVATARSTTCCRSRSCWTCRRRNACGATKSRPDRTFGARVIGRQSAELRRSVHRLAKEGFRRVHVLRGQDEIDAARIVVEPLRNDLRGTTGPFDVIGDVHGCRAELETLLDRLGYRIERDDEGRPVTARHPERTAVFLGDLVDRGPDSPGVLRLVMGMVAAGSALAVCGNHEQKLVRALAGRNVRVSHGLAETLAQLSAQPQEFRAEVARFCDGLLAHYVLDGGKLVVAHAGLPERYHGRASGRVRGFALYGDTTGETDEYGLPVRYPWADDYRGRTTVLYGHTPVPRAEWVNNTLCVDTGCVFGGELTALRYPEREIVSVPAEQVWYEPAKPLTAPEPTRPPDVLALSGVTGKRIVETGYRGRVSVRPEQAAAALEVMSRFATDPRWLLHLPPTMAPTATSKRDDVLEHPAEAFAGYLADGVTSVLCEEKHMGSRAVVLVCRASARFGVEGPGAVVTRTGRSFFDAELTGELLARVGAAVTATGLWDELDTDWLLLDTELMPWTAKARQLIMDQYAAVGAAATAALPAAVRTLAAVEARGVGVADLLARTRSRAANATAFRAAYRRHCWPTDGLTGVRIAPFQLLATEGATYHRREHAWHLALADRLVAADGDLFATTRRLAVDTADQQSVADGERWWTELTDAGGEGMVVKPAANLTRGPRGLVQPGVKVRGREYLRIIYGPDYTAPEHLTRLRDRNLGAKRSLALREYALGLESLDRAAAGEPLWRVHECVFGVLALESEPVDPRL